MFHLSTGARSAGLSAGQNIEHVAVQSNLSAYLNKSWVSHFVSALCLSLCLVTIQVLWFWVFANTISVANLVGHWFWIPGFVLVGSNNTL